jgi:hypothetical protein
MSALNPANYRVCVDTLDNNNDVVDNEVGRCCFCNGECSVNRQACKVCIQSGKNIPYQEIRNEKENNVNPKNGWMIFRDENNTLLKVDYDIYAVKIGENIKKGDYTYANITVYVKNSEKIELLYSRAITGIRFMAEDFERLKQAVYNLR